MLLGLPSLLRHLLLFATLGAQLLPGAPQSTQDKKAGKKQPPPAQKKEPAPLFGGQIGIRSSQKTKESATLGFNGIDPSGKVQKKMLAATPSPEDSEKVRNMDTTRPSRTELAVFLRAGDLKRR
jgi:hypothetical protein